MSNSSTNPPPTTSSAATAEIDAFAAAGKGLPTRTATGGDALKSPRSKKVHQSNYLNKKKLMGEEMASRLQHQAAEVEKESALHAGLMADCMAKQLNIDYADSLLQIAQQYNTEYTTERRNTGNNQNHQKWDTSNETSESTHPHDEYSIETSVAESSKYYSINLGPSTCQESDTVTAPYDKSHNPYLQ